LVVKGIMVGEDGRHATDHGACYLDTTLATIEALPEVVEAVAGRAEVYMDGGIRHGRVQTTRATGGVRFVSALVP
jgi:isopentenyl diphosphate isomerase/L-lactate dehydrogenase-like FMN-dependent dehydrogenase